MSDPDLSAMSPYDRAAWDQIEQWRTKRSERSSLIPARPKRVLARIGTAAGRSAADLPGAGAVSTAVQRALEGAFLAVDRVSVATVHKRAIITRFSKAGCQVGELSDIRRLDLRMLDRVRPRVDLRYMLASAAEGAGAGAAMTGAEALTAGGTVVGMGAGAAPGVGLLLGITVADAVAVVGACSRVAAEIGAYYGYDAELPQERLYSLGVLGVAMATSETAKAAAFQELNKVVQALARRKSWKELDKLVMTKVVKRVLGKYAERVTQRKLGQAIPIAGIVLGAGLNAMAVNDVATSAHHLYRERFLRDKYDMAVPDPPATNEEGVDIMSVVEDELAADGDVIDAVIVDEDQ